MAVKSPIPWNGAKTRGCKILASHLPLHIDNMVSIFIGGASFELYCEDVLRINVTNAYDNFQPLITFWKQVKNKETAAKMVEVVAEMAKNGFGRERYTQLKDKYNKHIRNQEIIENDFDLACLFYFCHKFSFSSTPMFYSYSPTKDNERGIKNALKALYDFHTAINFECADFTVSMAKHNSDFLYLDPPYYIDGEKLKRECYVGHKKFDHVKFAECVKNHKGQFMLSYGDCEFVRDVYKDYRMIELKWPYSMRNMNARTIEPYELLIMNY